MFNNAVLLGRHFYIPPTFYYPRMAYIAEGFVVFDSVFKVLSITFGESTVIYSFT